MDSCVLTLRPLRRSGRLHDSRWETGGNYAYQFMRISNINVFYNEIDAILVCIRISMKNNFPCEFFKTGGVVLLNFAENEEVVVCHFY